MGHNKKKLIDVVIVPKTVLKLNKVTGNDNGKKKSKILTEQPSGHSLAIFLQAIQNS